MLFIRMNFEVFLTTQVIAVIVEECELVWYFQNSMSNDPGQGKCLLHFSTIATRVRNIRNPVITI